MAGDLGSRLALRAAFYDLHPEGLEGYVKERREAGMSWADIALNIESECGSQFHGRTIHRMFMERGWAKEPVKWWKSEAVTERRAARKASRQTPALKAAE